MGAWQGLGTARIGVGILVNIGWWGVPKSTGPQDRSKLTTDDLAEEITAWRPQYPCFWQTNKKCLEMIFGLFSIWESPGGPPRFLISVALV